MPKKEALQSRNSEGLLSPAHTERDEQYDTLCGQEDGHFLTLWGSYNSLVVGRICKELDCPIEAVVEIKKDPDE